MPRNKLSNTGVVGFPSNATDPAGIAGDIHFNSATGQFRGFNTAWQNIPTGDSLVTGLIVYVDTNSATATDTRTGLPVTSTNRPFKTINAAVNARPTQDHVIFVRKGTYTENVNAPSNAVLNLFLEPDVVINGNIYNRGDTFIAGVGLMDSKSNIVKGTAQIYTNTDAASGGPNGGPLGGIQSDGVVYLRNLITRNTGTGAGVSGLMGMFVDNARIISIGPATNEYSFYSPVYISNSWIFSRDSYCSECKNATEAFYKNSTLISTATTGETTIWGGYYNHPCFVEDCRIHSESAQAIYGARTYGSNPVLIRNNYFNTFGRAIMIGPGGAAGSGYENTPVFEITGNVIGVRNAAEPHAFSLEQMTTHAIAPVVMNNRFNKATFLVTVAGQTTIDIDNVGSIGFQPPHPVIYDPNVPLLRVGTELFRDFLFVTLIVLTVLLTQGISLTDAEQIALDNLLRGLPSPSPARAGGRSVDPPSTELSLADVANHPDVIAFIEKISPNRTT